ncbi:MAG: PAS domain S-box protein, partial [bacterium]|nr:PAS domain S-box protein [bacterium]
HQDWLAAVRETIDVSDKRDFKAFSDWRGRFVLIVLGAAVLAILAHLYFSSRYMEASIVEQFHHRQLTLVESSAGRIQERLQRVEDELMWLVRMPGLLRRETAGESDPQDILREAENFIKAVYMTQGGFVHGVYLVDPQGVILMRHSPKKEALGATIPEKALLAETLASPDVVTLGPFKKMRSGELGLSFIAPIFKGGAPAGAVRVVVDLSTIAKEFILPLKTTENSYAFLMDERGLILYHPREEHVGKTLDEAGRGSFFKRFPRDQQGETQEGYFTYQRAGAGGGSELVAFSFLEVGGQRLVLALVTPREDIAGPIKKYKRRNGAFAGLLLLIVAFSAYKYTESRNRRVLLEREREHFLRERELAEELRLLYRAGQTVIRGMDLEETLGFIVQETPAFLGSTHCYILLMDEDRDELFGAAATEPHSDDFKTTRIRMDEPSAAVWVLTHNEPIISSRARGDERLSERLVEQYQVRSAAFLPLIVRDRPLGVLIYAHDQQEGAFDYLNRNTLDRFADQTALAIANAKLFNQVKESRDYLETLIEQSMDAIIATDREEKVILFNQGAETLSGYRREEVIGRRGPILYESEEDAKKIMRRMREGDGTLSAFETTFRAKDGTSIPVLISASLLYDEEGREAGTVGFSKDLRERKRAEEALIKGEKMASLGRLTAGVSHEILNPLTVITLALHRTISNPDTPPEIASDFQDMKEQADRIYKITRGLLYFARHRPPERRSVDFNETIRRTVSLIEHDLKLNNIAVELNLTEELPPIYADHDQIHQVILNLLTNARDAMPDGGRLVLSTAEVEPLFENERKPLELRVEDTGPGIAAEHMDKLFDPFFTTKAEGEGTGLGLSICQGIVEAHGGTIWAENVPGGGAVFAVRLHTEEAEEKEGQAL